MAIMAATVTLGIPSIINAGAASAPVVRTVAVESPVIIPGNIINKVIKMINQKGCLCRRTIIVLLILPSAPERRRASIKIMAVAIIKMGSRYANVPSTKCRTGMPYIGFELPLMFATFPLAFGVNLALGYKYLKNINLEKILPKLGRNYFTEYGWRLYAPLIIVIVLMLGVRIAPQYFPNLGVPLIFMIGAVAAIFCGEKMNFMKVSHKAIQEALPVLGILIGIGMFIQIMTLNGVRGMLVISSLSLPDFWRYASMGTMIPLFGAVSAYGSASVLGVPFLLAFLGQNEIIVGSALSLLTGLGDLMPPTALAGIFAAQVVGEKNYFKVLKVTLYPALATIIWGLAMIYFANVLAAFL